MIIDPEFRALCPPLCDEELTQLQSNLQRDGCRDPLVVWQEEDILLDGHNRYTICQDLSIPYHTNSVRLPGRDAAKEWIIRNQFGRRNLTPYQRAELALQLEPLIRERAEENLKQSGRQFGRGAKGCQISDNPIPRIDTKQELAKAAGVSHDTIAKAKHLAGSADEATKAKLRRGETTIHAEYRRLRKQQAQQQREEKKSAHVEIPAEHRLQLIQADVAKATEHVEAESVDWIITDPPYPRQYLEVFSHLGAFAAHALKPHGSMIAMVGQSYLPEIIARLGETLQYHWTLAYLTPGGQAVQLWERKVNTFWKPLLWFTKGKYGGDWIGDVCRSDVNDNDKQHHHWGQSVSGMVDVLRRFAYPGQVVCDPFVGAGTTGIAALACGCQFIGLDIDDECLEKTRVRISQSHFQEDPCGHR